MARRYPPADTGLPKVSRDPPCSAGYSGSTGGWWHQQFDLRNAPGLAPNLAARLLHDDAKVGPAGFGFVHGKGATAAQKATTVYASYSFPLMGVKGAFITPALSYAKGGTGTDNQLAARVRINYAF